jgi:Tfp pilus assembly protein PilO
LPRGLAGRRLDERLARAQAQIEAHRLESERVKQRQQLLLDNARDAQRLLVRLVGQRETTLVPVLAEIERHASELGVTTGARALTPSELKDTPLTQLEISVPFEGNYSRVVGFMRRLEHSKAFLTVDKLKLAQKDEGTTGRTTLNITLSAYFSSSPEEAGERRANRGR